MELYFGGRKLIINWSGKRRKILCLWRWEVQFVHDEVWEKVKSSLKTQFHLIYNILNHDDPRQRNPPQNTDSSQQSTQIFHLGTYRSTLPWSQSSLLPKVLQRNIKICIRWALHSLLLSKQVSSDWTMWPCSPVQLMCCDGVCLSFLSSGDWGESGLREVYLVVIFSTILFRVIRIFDSMDKIIISLALFRSLPRARTPRKFRYALPSSSGVFSTGMPLKPPPKWQPPRWWRSR